MSLVTLLLAAPLLLSQADGPTAPDGRRGLGAGTELQELLRFQLTPTDEELALQRELADLLRDVAVLASLTEGFYRERGYFDLLDPLADPTLANLHAAYRRHLADPAGIAPRRNAVSRAFARAFLDTRFRVRAALLEGWEREADEVRGGLAVLRAAAHGFVVLDEAEGANAARRVDLAAALLRAARTDLASLREPMETAASTGPAPEDVEAFLEAFEASDRAEREQRVGEALARGAEQERLMAEVLLSSRLRASAAAELAWRAEQDALARGLLEEARQAFPDEEHAEPPREIQRLSKTRRRRLAREKAVLGLRHDPLDTELVWIAAETSRFVFGEREMVSHYDRYLALRGIVHYDERTYRDRQLTGREAAALFQVKEQERNEQVPRDQ